MATIDYNIASYCPYSASATGSNGMSRDFLAGIAATYSIRSTKSFPVNTSLRFQKWFSAALLSLSPFQSICSISVDPPSERSLSSLKFLRPIERLVEVREGCQLRVMEARGDISTRRRYLVPLKTSVDEKGGRQMEMA